MKTLLLATACAAAFLSPAQATVFSETNEDTALGLYFALAYDSDCKPGSLTSDSRQFIAFWIKQIPEGVRKSALAQVKEASTMFGKELFCGVLRKNVEPSLSQINSNSAKVMPALRPAQ